MHEAMLKGESKWLSTETTDAQFVVIFILRASSVSSRHAVTRACPVKGSTCAINATSWISWTSGPEFPATIGRTVKYLIRGVDGMMSISDHDIGLSRGQKGQTFPILPL